MSYSAAFVINENDHSIAVQKDFDANLQTIWDCWTKAEYLDKWWAPKPYITETKALYFRPAGFWLYAMVSPQGDKHFCKADYEVIKDLQSFSFTDAFCSEEGKTLNDKPRSHWTCSFAENNTLTTVTINIGHDSSADLADMLNMGFKEGFGMALDNLSNLVTEVKTTN